MGRKAYLITSILALSIISVVHSKTIELTFELRDGEQQCFHEDIEDGTKVTLDFQVLSGGNIDIDVAIYSPDKRILYQEEKKKWDNHEWDATGTGQYTICFSNQFSTFSHKLVYFELIVGEEDGEWESLVPKSQQKAANDLLKFHMNAEVITENLASIEDAQRLYRLSESLQRKRAEALNKRVLWWSSIETVAFVLIGIIQVWTLKSFFRRQSAPVAIS